MHGSRPLIALAILLTALAAMISPNHVLVTAVGGTFVLGVWLLWPRTDAPILLMPFALQWLQVAVKPIQTALTGQPLESLSDFGEPLTPAAYLGVATVAALALGMRIGAITPRRTDWRQALAVDASLWRARPVIELSLGAIILGHLLQTASNYAGPARETLVVLSGVRMGGLFVLGYWCLSQRRHLGVLLAVAAIEVVIGMTGFFGAFRDVLFVLIVAAAAARPRVTVGSFVGLAAIGGALIVAAIFWSAIKPDYRAFLNDNTGQQVILRPMNERLTYVGGAAQGFNLAQFDRGLDALVSRTSYIDFLGRVMVNVPDNIPFQDGAQTTQAIVHVVTPRIFFPNKPQTPNDTEVTAHYTGMDLDLSGATSISIGYVGEFYIDFGYVGAVVGAFLLGVFAGRAYAILRGFTGTPLLLNYGLAAIAALPFAVFESALIKLLGAAVAAFLVCFALKRWLAPPLVKSIEPTWAAAFAERVA